MKKINKKYLALFIFSGLLFSQSEANDALRDLSPYIGKWESKQSSYGLFEGLPDNTDIIYNVEYEWIAFVANAGQAACKITKKEKK